MPKAVNASNLLKKCYSKRINSALSSSFNVLFAYPFIGKTQYSDAV